ncbi:peptidyl-prolyl cis-trans isomerase FKBP4 isoform X2 [Strongylocentrotus purpuratus]|uniref:peptidylprolyl isomerase n=1 Tax=Strongylocentrotus purpuratus TaxID=7668 RepID=A0A7M7P2T6_STRPU|nr:peptidyl-prolyl cis-trans isomerase FKBP4 isoform X1 [Strongylocentrotus purpuratus]XP_030845484.1 peptidyl-prolyl cis-trans isomerase FKBP4 isoform X2 [Strongylocentrotus purpuratus]
MTNGDDNKPSITTEDEYQPFPDPLMGTGQDVTPNGDGGVLKAIRKEGDTTEEDRPFKGDKVFVHYVGSLTDGVLFDSSRSRNEKFSFTLGKGEVIKAWDMGVATMRRGEIAVITCKPEYAYGKSSKAKIPANSTLVFEVELFDWKGEDLSEDNDEGIVRRIVTEGQEYDTPNDEAKVEAHIIGRYDGKEFENRDVEYTVTEGSDAGIVEGLEIAIKRMKKGEVARLKVKSKYAYGSQGKAEYNIPGNADVTYEVLLKNFEKAKEPWEMDIAEKLEQSEVVKAKGTNYFKQGRYQDAIKQWKKIITYLDKETITEEEQKKKSDAMQLAANLNVAMAAIKAEEFLEAVSHCDKAIEFDAVSVKGYFRRGQAYYHLTEYEKGKVDFLKVLEIEPENKAAKNQLTLSNQKLKQHLEKEKKIYGNMFERFADQDRREKLARERARGDLEVGVFSDGEKKTTGSEEENEGSKEGGEQIEEEAKESLPAEAEVKEESKEPKESLPAEAGVKEESKEPKESLPAED